MFLIKSIFFLFVFTFSSLAFADNLGRLFTSVSDRQKLERVKLKKDEPKKVVAEEVIIPEEAIQIETEIIKRNEVALKGIVHRSDGKNTAWINESNTFEGDLDSQYIQIPNDKIDPEKVTVIMPDDSTHFDLKVGESFVPEPIEREVVNTE
jgi:hypothetical protein